MLPAESKRMRALDRELPKTYRDILNNDDGVIPERADLPSWLRFLPSGKPLTRNSKYPVWVALLRPYFQFSDTKAWAREGLRGLLRELLNNREPLPALLQRWALYQCAEDPPKPSRGRPEESDRNFRVHVVFALLRRDGYSREFAFSLIAGHLVCEPETVRSIIRKCKSDRPNR